MKSHFFSERQVNARKQHRCDACYSPIDMGTTYCYMAFSYEGDFYAVKNHLECRAAECGLAELHGLYGGEDWLHLHDLEDEDREWVEVNHPKAYARAYTKIKQVRPFDAFRDDPVGNDKTLITQGEN